MAALTPPSSSDSNRLTALFKRVTKKSIKSPPPPSPCSEPGLSRDSSVSSGGFRRAPRKVIPRLPRTKTFQRQQSEDRDKLETFLPTPAERRAVSVDRRMHPQRSSSYSSQVLPRAIAPGFFGAEATAGKFASISRAPSVLQDPVDEIHSLSLNGIDTTSIIGGEGHEETGYPDDTMSTGTSRYEATVHDELEQKWILNISMHFRDKSMREKFFVTYREQDSIWRRVTISLDYRNAPHDSLEQDLLETKFQRDKSSKIYRAIRESLQDIQFYPTVTNLKLETAGGRLHVHVVEDVNEIIPFPTTRLVEHMNCPRIRESQIKFDCHMSGFVYRVQVNGMTLIKKEIPGPDTIDEFLYEINALNSLRSSRSVIDFYGVVVDDDDEVVKGLLIGYAEQGALIEVIYNCRERGEQDLPWATRERWARQIVQGLSDIHETGFVQGDFTLSNIVIDDRDNAKIIDINRRGCPVGWEPPEAILLIENNQRISMYIGVKSDLYQLGMVLWALATLEDEPEAHRRPLRLKAELDIPEWYRRIVETCLQVNPRDRLQATELLSQFPEASDDDIYGEWELPTISLNDGAFLERLGADERFARPEIRHSCPLSSASNTQPTSPSFSDEPYYPPRGRSPPSPSPDHHGFYLGSSHIYGNEMHDMWAKGNGIAVMDGEPADEMAHELEQLAASYCPEAVSGYEQARARGGNSLALEAGVVAPIAAADGEDESITLSDEDEAQDSTPTYNATPNESLGGTPLVEKPQPNELTAPADSLRNIEATGKENQDDSDAEVSLRDNKLGITKKPNPPDQAESTAAELDKMETTRSSECAIYA
ncbi:hypothetical protein F4861DRAFT_348863 [Xylaria intraflava]|nr:hypothetical protein F4861DRAFT_348863 [Xylaria intraflava]